MRKEEIRQEIYLVSVEIFLLLSKKLCNPSRDTDAVFLQVKAFQKDEAKFIGLPDNNP